MNEKFKTIRKGNYRIVRRWHWGYGHYLYILQERIFWIFYVEVERSGVTFDLIQKMNSYIKLGI